MDIFVREDGDKFRVFFGPDSAGFIAKEDLSDPNKVEHIIRQIAYGYYWKINPKPTQSIVRLRRPAKEQGIIKDIVDIFW